jgi:hypothetical protein
MCSDSRRGQLKIWESNGIKGIVVAGYLHALLYKYALSFDDYADIRRNSKKKRTHLVSKLTMAQRGSI